MLFSEGSLWTMLHGIGFGGGAMLTLAAVLFAIYLMRESAIGGRSSELPARRIGQLTAFSALLLWLTSIVGTYIVFPTYRTPPPDGATDLTAYPRALLLADDGTAWLHRFAMETKEYLPWIATMLATAAAFVAWQYGSAFLRDRSLRRLGSAFLVACFVLVSYISLLGVFINKVAPVY